MLTLELPISGNSFVFAKGGELHEIYQKMLLGFAFLLIALMGVILYEDNFGYVLFIIGAPIGLLFCIIGCFDEEIKALLAEAKKDEGSDKNEE